MNPLILLLFLAAFVAPDKIPDFVVPGKCPKVDESKLWLEQKPDHSKFGGEWYTHSQIDNPYLLIHNCAYSQYKFDGENFEVTWTGITAEGDVLKREGSMYQSPFGEPHLVIDIKNAITVPVVILETDYENYACLYTCIDIHLGYEVEIAAIQSRSPDPSDEQVWRCEKAFKSLDVDISRLRKVVQGSSCPYDTLKSL